jgi:hypothetical protein
MSDVETPTTNGLDGRDGRGRFAAGNAGGPGNPYTKQTARLRAALLAAVTEEDIKAIVSKLIEQARGGNIPAAREVLDRTLGRSQEAELLQRVEELEAALAGVRGAGVAA